MFSKSSILWESMRIVIFPVRREAQLVSLKASKMANKIYLFMQKSNTRKICEF